MDAAGECPVYTERFLLDSLHCSDLIKVDALVNGTTLKFRVLSALTAEVYCSAAVLEILIYT